MDFKLGKGGNNFDFVKSLKDLSVEVQRNQDAIEHIKESQRQVLTQLGTLIDLSQEGSLISQVKTVAIELERLLDKIHIQRESIESLKCELKLLNQQLNDQKANITKMELDRKDKFINRTIAIGVSVLTALLIGIALKLFSLSSLEPIDSLPPDKTSFSDLPKGFI